MKLTRPVPMWQQVADHLRTQILDGTYPPGQPLPSEEALAAEFEVSRPTIREGIKTLVAEGLAEVSRPHGTTVRDPFGRPARTEHRNRSAADRDDGWTDVGDAWFYRANATADQADLLAIPAGEPLLVRESTQESAGLRRLSRIYLPFSVAEHTPWADDGRLPPAPELRAHFRDAGDTLTWTERVRARTPVGEETSQLGIPAGVALLVTLRVCHAGKQPDQLGQPVTLQETRHRADQIELAYTLC
jgi:GntR family transcriptional regulator